MSIAFRSISSSLLFVLAGVACDPADDSAQSQDDQDFRGHALVPGDSIPDRLPIPDLGDADDDARYGTLMTVGIDGQTFDIRELLEADDHTVPRARIVGAFRTTATPTRQQWSSVVDTSTSAAQVYRCNGATWQFDRPEAGLVPLLADGDGGVIEDANDSFVLDHFRFPGNDTVAAGPAWRIVRNQPVLRQAYQLYVGATTSADFASVTNPEAPDTAITLLRVPSASQGFLGWSVAGGFSANLPNGRGFLFRLDTIGGRAPASCDPSSNGQELRVPYTTDYYFVQLVES